MDRQSGLINKVAVTPANKADAEVFAYARPSKVAGFEDKDYCVNSTPRIAKSKGSFGSH